MIFLGLAGKYIYFVLQCNIVGYDEGQSRVLEKALVLEDVLSDLPAVRLLNFLLAYSP